MKRVNIQLSKETHTRAKILSVLKGQTLNDYLAAAIERQLEKDDKTLKKLQ